MTIEEALHVVPSDVEFHFKDDTMTITVPAEWVSIAMQAIEKQVPKKNRDWRCPICNAYPHYEDDGLDTGPAKFCGNCGQAILWED